MFNGCLFSKDFMNLVQGNLNVTRTVSKIALKAEPLVDGLWYRSHLGFY